ncbi:chromosomal replication initiation protein [bacterium BMS3Abin07]|nr:chromosomal replication initiation protein [bacterium BMS3Abin07]GBE32370.1 chromosomal replication initiation protein [bacterium BMS3Bbin05]HDL20562.1 transposase [Nitrospirota bacterium]
MARPLRIEYKGAVYHVTGRGNERRKTYFTPADYQKFIEYIKTARDRYGIILHAYVLMSNQYHLIIETPDAGLSKAMHHIISGYTMYINKKKKRSGHLFQGRFKSVVVEKDSCLVELSRYIHLNPVRAKMAEKPEDYPYSSYPYYITKKKSDILSTGLILSLQSGDRKDAKRRYRDYVESAIGKEIENPCKKVYGGMILGRNPFIKEVLKKLKRQYLQRGDISHRRQLMGRHDMEEIIELVAQECGVTKDDILKGRDREARKAAVYLTKKHTEVTNREIGKRFGGVSYSAVSKVVERTEREMEENRNMRRRINRMNRKLSPVKG